jgi:hypothetical protein
MQWILDWFGRNAPEVLSHLDRPSNRDYYALEQERLDLDLRCQALEAILLAKGETSGTIARKIAMYQSAKDTVRERRA